MSDSSATGRVSNRKAAREVACATVLGSMLGSANARILGAAIALLLSLGVGWAMAEYAPILHEHFDPDPKEDVELGVRITAAGLPAAIPGQTGPVALPDPLRPANRKDPAYSERPTAAANRFRIDRETTDPGRLTYHEPFRPSIAPFKRTHAFDTVTSEFDLAVADPRLRPVTMAGTPGPLEDQFFGDLVLDLLPGDWIRVASAGPHMAIYSAHLEPETPFGFYVDSAENWFVRAPEGRGRMRLVMHVGVVRSAFDGRIEATSYSQLVSHLPQVPANVERAATQVLQRIGISRVLAPADALNELVVYFRGFAQSKAWPNATQGEALYRELVTSRKGVCRHRAYAFVVTALGLGIPARFVNNEAHAWVEVFGGTDWHRIDLGGAASGIDYRGTQPEGAPHRPPADAYAWPKQAQAAQQSLAATMASSGNGTQAGEAAQPGNRTQAGDGANTATPTSEANQPTLSAPAHSGSSGEPDPGAPSSSATSGEQSLAPDDMPSSAKGRITLALAMPPEVERGKELGISGKVEAAGAHCEHVRVDIALVRQAHRIALGTLATDEGGRFVARLTVPADLAVGSYDLIASTPGSRSCPAASSD